jgi:hypothetical protein
LKYRLSCESDCEAKASLKITTDSLPTTIISRAMRTAFERAREIGFELSDNA